MNACSLWVLSLSLSLLAAAPVTGFGEFQTPTSTCVYDTTRWRLVPEPALAALLMLGEVSLLLRRHSTPATDVAVPILDRGDMS